MGEIVRLRGKIPEVGKDAGRGDEAQSIPRTPVVASQPGQPASSYPSLNLNFTLSSK